MGKRKKYSQLHHLQNILHHPLTLKWIEIRGDCEEYGPMRIANFFCHLHTDNLNFVCINNMLSPCYFYTPGRREIVSQVHFFPYNGYHPRKVEPFKVYANKDAF